MTLGEIRRALESLEARPVKTLGQNFLHDQNLARWLADSLDPQPGDVVVEIGPGLGALTEYLAGRVRRMILLEKDGRLAGYLRGKFTGANVEVRHEDATRFDARQLFPAQPVRVIGNLPYYVSTPLLFAFAGDPSPASCLVFTLQRELARRLSAGPSTADYGALTLIVQRRWRVEYLRTLPASVFYPEPGVASGVVRLTPRPPDELPGCDRGEFARLVKLGFSQRRKQLGKLLQLPAWPDLAERLGVLPTVRAEALSLVQWIALTNLVAADGAPPAQDVHGEMFDVVDAHDRPVRVATRHEVHTGRLLHRAVHIFIFNSEGELFLQKRSPWKDLCPSLWDSSAAGHLNAGQDYPGTARRELEEELGVTTPLEEIARLPATRETGWEHVALFTGKHDGPFRLPPAEIATGGFFPLRVIEDWMAGRPADCAPGFVTSFESFLGRNESNALEK